MFITLEGPDGSGKTTQIPRLAEYLRSRGLQVLTTREPGGTPISDQVRQVIMSMKNQEMDPRTEILLFCAARAQLVNQLVRPALEQGM
ncbi:dTMP kinase, partial [bacterium]|nr:dTMP kinase [bacterium]